MPTAGGVPVRLSAAERAGILAAVGRACAEAAVPWRRIVLFGSRVDPARRGGDIDLLIELDRPPLPSRLRFTQRLRLALEDTIGEQKVDLVVDDGADHSAFLGIARDQGVPLWINE